MNMYTKTAGLAAAVALMATPAWATGAPDGTPNGSDNPGTTHRSATPGPHASLPAKARAYGRYCKTESKKHADAAPGTKGSPFSQCVTAMAKLANGRTDSPREACKLLSKKHSDAAPGTKGSPFSQCVSGGARLLRDQHAQEQQSSDDQSTGTDDQQTSTS
jgi:hypothetical protein